MRRALLRLAAAGLLAGGAAAPARAAYEDMGAGARAPGMGNAFVPVADDVYALYYNPAGLGLLDRPQLGTSYTVLFPGLQDASNLSTSFIGFAQPLAEGRKGALATGWNSVTLGSQYREDTFSLGYGRRWADWGDAGELYGGAALKYLRSGFGSFPEASNAVPSGGLVGAGGRDPVLGGSRSQSAADADAGALYRLGKNYSFGLDVMHVNQPNVAFAPGATDRLPAAVKLGLDYRSLLSNLAVEYDTQKSPRGSQDHTFTAASERWFPKLFLGDFGLRGALSVGTREFRQLSTGLSFRSRRFNVDYALTLPVTGLGTAISSHRLALTFRFGRATEDEESLEMVLEAMKQIKSGQRAELKTAEGATGAQRLVLDEYLAQERAAESHARYQEALEQFALALSVAPADKAFAERYGRLAFVGQQIRSLPGYRDDPIQASLHLGVLAYVGGDFPEAVRKVSEALALAPGRKDVEGFLSQLEVATGLKRSLFAAEKAPDRQAAVLLTRANAALEDRRYDEAVSASLEVLRSEPDSAAAWEDLGTAYFALKSYPDSLKAWNRAYELEKSPAVRTAIRGYIRSITRAETKAAPAHAAAPAVQPLPERPSLTPAEERDLFNEGVDHYTRREYGAARAAFEKIVAADPDNVEARNALRRLEEERP